MADLRPVSGFLFSNTEEINAAKKEAKAVQYLKERLKGRTPEAARSMYEQILSQGLFHTAVGYSFLKDLQESLIASGMTEVSPIPVDNVVIKQAEAAPLADAGSAPNPRLEKKLKNLSSQLSTMRVVAVVCIVMVISMFAITLTSKSPTILDYETKILDKYATWEQELTEREAAVSAREADLGIVR